jgi:hypothetical protein
LSSNIDVLWVEVEQFKISLKICGADYQDDDDDDDDDDVNNDSHVIHAIFYWNVKSPSNFTTKPHFII